MQLCVAPELFSHYFILHAQPGCPPKDMVSAKGGPFIYRVGLLSHNPIKSIPLWSRPSMPCLVPHIGSNVGTTARGRRRQGGEGNRDRARKHKYKRTHHYTRALLPTTPTTWQRHDALTLSLPVSFCVRNIGSGGQQKKQRYCSRENSNQPAQDENSSDNERTSP